MSKNFKKIYEKPLMTVTILEIECAIANSSARVVGNDNNMQIFEEWTEESDQIIIDWM